MSKVVAFRRSVIEEAHEIAAKFAEAYKFENRANDMRIALGFDLLALRKRIEDGEAGPNIEWWPWIKQFCHRSKRDMERVMALARAADPKAALEAERKKNRLQTRASRARQKTIRVATDMSQSTVVPLNIVQRALSVVLPLVKQMTAAERQEFIAKLREEYP